jgi:5-methylcytosine-specific restriction protein A
MEGLIGQELRTPVEREPNWILGIEGSRVRVATDDNREGALVPISLVQGAVDRIYDGEEVIFNPRRRAAFLGAVLETMDDIEVLHGPRRARLAPGAAQRNPDWTYDELILALDLYMRWRPRQPPSGHADLEALSDLLQRLPIHPLHTRADDFRNANGVRRKLGDFTAPDPDYTGAPTRGGSGVHEVWTRFADDRAALADAVARITATANGEVELPPAEEDEEGSVEGRIVFRQHRAYERDQALPRRKKAAVLQRTGSLACEVCGMDFSERYGELGKGFIECHHTQPLGTGEVRETTLADLALVCSNCHRMIHRSHHRSGRMLLPTELRQLLQPSPAVTFERPEP